MAKNIRFYPLILVLMLITSLFYAGCKKTGAGEGSCSDGLKNQDETGIDCGGACGICLDNRDSVVLDYNNNYVGSAVTDPGWTGNASTCDAGTVPQSTHDKVLMRINYFRRLVGLNDNTAWDISKFPQFQQTALMMKANSALSHTPPNTWTCWTSEGSAGAGLSNLALGSHSTNAVTAFIEDNGSGNQVVGHRRWILHSAKMQFSYGTTNSTMSLGVIGVAGGNTKIPEYIAYPPKGFVPQALVFDRWSFSIPGANFSAASVSVTDGAGGSITAPVVSKTDNGYGDNTIVWEPAGINTTSTDDISYNVTVSGITGAPQASYSYTVTLIKP